MIKDKIKEDFKKAMKDNDKEKIRTLRYTISEFQRRQNHFDKISDKEAISILNKIVKAEKEFLKYTNETSSYFIEILEKYLPKLMSKDEIENWIKENIPEAYEIESKQRMKYMKNIMTELGSNVNGNDVKEVLLK